jgi:mRNA interferase MazF
MDNLGKKDFDGWNILKKKIEERNIIYCNEREIWWCSIGENIGSETSGKNQLFERPVLILRVYNSQQIVIVPLSSRQKKDRFHQRIFFAGEYGWCILSQVKTISTKRLRRKFFRVDRKQFKQVITTYIDLFRKSETPH